MKQEELIRRCLLQQRESQKILYDSYADDLLAISVRYCGNLEEAKDALQNAFIKIFKQLKTYDPNRGKFKSWMIKIVINEALQLLRKKKMHISQLDLVENKYSYEPDIFSKMGTEDILNIIEQLPPGYKFVFNMYVIEGFSHREISESLNIAESASRSQLARAKKLLQELIAQQKIFKVC